MLALGIRSRIVLATAVVPHKWGPATVSVPPSWLPPLTLANRAKPQLHAGGSAWDSGWPWMLATGNKGDRAEEVTRTLAGFLFPSSALGFSQHRAKIQGYFQRQPPSGGTP